MVCICGEPRGCNRIRSILDLVGRALQVDAPADGKAARPEGTRERGVRLKKHQARTEIRSRRDVYVAAPIIRHVQAIITVALGIVAAPDVRRIAFTVSCVATAADGPQSAFRAQGRVHCWPTSVAIGALLVCRTVAALTRSRPHI